jgi:hypothetical protein
MNLSLGIEHFFSGRAELILLLTILKIKDIDGVPLSGEVTCLPELKDSLYCYTPDSGIAIDSNFTNRL